MFDHAFMLHQYEMQPPLMVTDDKGQSKNVLIDPVSSVKETY